MDVNQSMLAEQAFQMMECGNIQLRAPIEYGILFVGNTKAGKTTSAQFISNQVLVGVKGEKGRSDYYKIQASRFQGAKIGIDERKSQTWIPNLFQINMGGDLNKGAKNHDKRKSYLIDCPGYLDSFGCYRIISNRFFHYLVFSKVQKAKFVITIPYSDMEGTCVQMLSTFREFLKGFRKLSEIKGKIIEATSIMVTNVPVGMEKEEVVARFNSSSSNIGGDLQETFAEMKKAIVDNERVFIFHKAEAEKICPKTTILEELKKEGKKEGRFWIRQLDDEGEVDMSNVKMSIADYTQNDPGLFFKELKSIEKFYKEQVLDLIDNFTGTIQKFTLDTEAGGENSEFIVDIQKRSQEKATWRKQVSECSKLYEDYNKERVAWKNELFNNKNGEKSQQSQFYPADMPFWLCKMKAFKIIEEMCAKISMAQGERDLTTLKNRQKMVKQILMQLIQLGRRKKEKSIKLDNQKNEQLINFAYEVYKDINLSNKLYELVAEDSQSKINPDAMKNLITGIGFLLMDYPAKTKKMNMTVVSSTLVEKLINNLDIVKVEEDLTSNAASEVAKFISIMIGKINEHEKKVQNQQQNKKLLQKGEKKPVMVENSSSIASKIEVQIDFNIIREKLNQKKIQFYNMSFESLRKMPNPSLSKLKQMQEVRQDTAKTIKSQEDRIIQNNKIVQIMAQVLEKNGQYDEAIALYDSIFDGVKIFQILDIKEDKVKKQGKKPKEMLKSLQEYMEKAKKYHWRETAIRKAQQARHYAIDACDKQRLNYINSFLSDICKFQLDSKDKFIDHVFNNGSEADIPPTVMTKIMDVADRALATRSPDGKKLK